MRLRLDLPVMNVSPSGLRNLCGYGPVADATGKDMSASGLKDLCGLLVPCLTVVSPQPKHEPSRSIPDYPVWRNRPAGNHL